MVTSAGSGISPPPLCRSDHGGRPAGCRGAARHVTKPTAADSDRLTKRPRARDPRTRANPHSPARPARAPAERPRGPANPTLGTSRRITKRAAPCGPRRRLLPPPVTTARHRPRGPVRESDARPRAPLQGAVDADRRYDRWPSDRSSRRRRYGRRYTPAWILKQQTACGMDAGLQRLGLCNPHLTTPPHPTAPPRQT